MVMRERSEVFFFFNDAPPTEISPLPLHDVLPISQGPVMNVPCSTTRVPPRALVIAATRDEPRRRRPVVIDGLGRGMRHHEAERPGLLLEQMGHEIGRAHV